MDAIYAQAVPLKAQANLAVAINTPGSFYSDADTLYVHLIDGSNPSKHTIEVSGSGHQNGIVAINKSFVTIQNLEIIRTTNSGVAFVLDSPNTAGNGPNQNNTLQALTIFNTGSSAPMPFGFDGGIMVRANTSYGSMAVTGWTIAKNLVGRLDSPVGLNYNIAGINMRGIKGAYIANNAVRTTTAMGIQDRNYGLASSCGANLIANNSLSDNEGNISAEENYDYVNNNKISNSRGFGIQVQSFGYATNNLIAHLKTSTDGTLYNGIDGAGGANAVYGNNNVSDVSGCSLTIEGTATGVQVLGGTYDATKGGQCALYTTASAGHVAFDGRTTWITKTPDAFRYRMASAGDRQNRMTQAKFMAATSGQ
ncbi:right-handed parallel beta-helix repeat-containing protein [Terriglobus roseus]|uniref:right-handed parallel beta-helix repeat-containing protein n=1 Tax=Terriglobus roseus TaxID=392734 RepID=UPI001FE0DE68|nr:right-handed parallel beta-helix repeat-containing protein [Terriglobus roseus]